MKILCNTKLVITFGLISTLAVFISDRAHALERTITTTGLCLTRALPDRGQITITANAVRNNSSLALAEAIKQYENLRKEIKKLKLANEELETADYSVHEEIEWVREKQVKKGYRARMGLNISTSQIDRLSDVMAIAARLNIHEVGGLRTFLSKDKMKSAKEDCLALAIDNARAKADKIAAVTKNKIDQVLSVTESNNNATSSDPISFKADSSRTGNPAGENMAHSIEYKPIEVSAEVITKWLLN